MKETLTRAARTRRLVALVAWAALVMSAMSLWNSRATGGIHAVIAEPVAFILAAFSAFIGVFAWMLYNPVHGSVAESPGQFLAAGVTLFPPPIIGFCLMPIESPLRWWLALGVFFLCAIAILSHVPDEFFAVPRGRHTYLTPIPTFDRVEDHVMDPNAAWFTFSDLGQVVDDGNRPSLAPRAYLQRTARPTAAPVRAAMTPVTEIDDILGPDFDVDFVDAIDLPENFDTDESPSPSRSAVAPRRMANAAGAGRSQQTDSETQSHSTDQPQADQAEPKRRPNYDLSPVMSGHQIRRRQSLHRRTALLPLSSPQSKKQALVSSMQVNRRGRRSALDQPVDGASAFAYSPPPAHRQDAAHDSGQQSYRRKSGVRETEASERDIAFDQLTTDEVFAAGLTSDTVSTKTAVNSQPAVQRTSETDGSELVEGVMKVRFEAGQKRANLHIPFAPPLTGVPEVECECIGGENIRLKVPVRQSYGIRIEARRSAAEEALEAEIGFAAVYTPE